MIRCGSAWGADLSRPGGNITGVTQLNVEVGPKRVELAHELIPAATVIALLVNPTNPLAEAIAKNSQAAARISWAAAPCAPRQQLNTISMQSSKPSCNCAPPRWSSDSADPLFGSRAEQLGTLALHYRVPAIHQFRVFAAAGGLASYGAALPTRTVRSVSTLGAFSKARSLATFRSSSPQSSSCDLTSRPQRRSASKCHRRCSPAPTR